MYDYFFFVFSAEAVVAFTDHFDKVGRVLVQCFLPQLAQAVDSSHCSPRFGPSAAETVDTVQVDVNKIQFVHNTFYKLFDIISIIVSN